jgi:uncharacterized membrane protein
LTAGPDGGIIASVRDPTKSPVDEGEAPRPAGTAFPAARRDRIWEIDFLRGLSIILMVGYHLLYDLGAMAGVQSLLGFTTDLTTPAWLAAQYFFAGLFVVLSGISSTLSRGNIRRALKLLAVALLVSAVTFFYSRDATIHFGILHCLAVSILIYGGLKGQSAGQRGRFGRRSHRERGPPVCLKGLTIRFDWLLPLGIHTVYASFDYFPLLPLGIFLGVPPWEIGLRFSAKSYPATAAGDLRQFASRHSRKSTSSTSRLSWCPLPPAWFADRSDPDDRKNKPSFGSRPFL